MTSLCASRSNNHFPAFERKDSSFPVFPPQLLRDSGISSNIIVDHHSASEILPKLYETIYQRMNEMNMKKTAATFLQETSQISKSCRMMTPDQIVEQCYTLIYLDNSMKNASSSLPNPISTSDSSSLIHNISSEEEISIPSKKNNNNNGRKREREGTDSESSDREQKVHKGGNCFTCGFEGCKGSFTTLANMKRHERLHTGERPFVCAIADCGKGFARKYDLKVHLRTHTKEKPYQCQLDSCLKRFSRISSLREHERNIHGVSHSEKDSIEIDSSRRDSPLDSSTFLSDGGNREFILENSSSQLNNDNEIVVLETCEDNKEDINSFIKLENEHSISEVDLIEQQIQEVSQSEIGLPSIEFNDFGISPSVPSEDGIHANVLEEMFDGMIQEDNHHDSVINA
eukprot:TRINITY_DN2237_c0_g1_i3.p1 TRINITY_DN2237_c0_g1~~TRINITY_DN2237_c0_g1_i3.p1  ORF type:complete len:400 (+),score=163.95 TRINITY_DN2237_c0_g1_i3:349-1548(+)